MVLAIAMGLSLVSRKGVGLGFWIGQKPMNTIKEDANYDSYII